MTADLHVHTTASDGRVTPDEILQQATAAGLSHIAITDHDTVDGLLALKDMPQLASQPEVIPGIEFSTDLATSEVHILGYFIDIRQPELVRQIKLIADDRRDRAERIVHKLNTLGYPISYRRVLEIAGEGSSVGRPHLAAALLEKGYFSNFNQAFTGLLEKNGPAYIPHYKLSRKDTIDLIVCAGGIPVLAHPGLVGNDSVVLDTIRLGIRGIEVYHPKHNPAQTEKYRLLADELGLAITGGSDFHGIAGRFPMRLGHFTVPAELVDHLKTLALSSTRNSFT
ncbi:MAG: PHP domain-containing protein [Negativicutes bacterium]|nr:PHP domain-containing protein [Negativicutes bacterium]